MSKQEARLPEKVGKALWNEHGIHADRGCAVRSEECGWCNQLRSAILAALDEARDEALTDAEASIAMMSCGCSLRVRALKSKRGA